MVQWAAFCYEWARTDPRLIGLNPWHWSGTPGAGQFQPGLAEMPAVLAAVSDLAKLTTSVGLIVWCPAAAKLCACSCPVCFHEQYQKIGREIVSGRQADIDFGI